MLLCNFSGGGRGLCPDYTVQGQYVSSTITEATDSQVKTQSAAEINTASGNRQTGVICDLCDPYFYENYYDQVYYLSYCDWDKIMSNK